jgi:hypothetical protein
VLLEPWLDSERSLCSSIMPSRKGSRGTAEMRGLGGTVAPSGSEYSVLPRARHNECINRFAGGCEDAVGTLEMTSKCSGKLGKWMRFAQERQSIQASAGRVEPMQAPAHKLHKGFMFRLHSGPQRPTPPHILVATETGPSQNSQHAKPGLARQQRQAGERSEREQRHFLSPPTPPRDCCPSRSNTAFLSFHHPAAAVTRPLPFLLSRPLIYLQYPIVDRHGGE